MGYFSLQTDQNIVWLEAVLQVWDEHVQCGFLQKLSNLCIYVIDVFVTAVQEDDMIRAGIIKLSQVKKSIAV